MHKWLDPYAEEIQAYGRIKRRDLYDRGDQTCSGHKPRTVVVAEVGEGQLTLKPEERIEHLLEKPRFKVLPISPKQMSRLRRELAKDLGER